MAITRAVLLAYVQEEFEELATLTGVASTDTLAGHKAPIDNTLLKLGVDYDSLTTGEAANSDAEAAFALLDYFELERFAKKLASKRDPKVGGGGADVEFKLSTQLAQVLTLLSRARARVESMGYYVSGSGWQSGSINLDYLEPAEAV